MLFFLLVIVMQLVPKMKFKKIPKKNSNDQSNPNKQLQQENLNVQTNAKKQVSMTKKSMATCCLEFGF